MSLMSLLNTTSSQAGYTYGSTLTGSSTSAISDALTTAQAAAATKTASTQDTVSISAAAKIAAAEKTDNAKDFTTLSTDVRATLDTQYAAAKTAEKTSQPAPDLSEMSGRALSAIILNKTGSFSGSEQLAAKAALRQRDRQDFVGASSSGTGVTALTAYDQQLVSQYDSMSDEERQARGWTAQVRSSADNFVQSMSGSSTANSSLFDLLNNQEDDS